MAEKEIGEVTNYFKQVKAAAVMLTSGLKIGDKIKIKGGEAEFEMTVDSIQIDRNKIVEARKGQEIGLLVPQDVNKGYRVFKV